ncbi:MAG TPA: hypothetical protein VM573_08490 [Actinomycetota bacterium]|jgi:hypothetical protein|nr:hypothetical protein [Actinomycetota bacterium]
MTISTRGYRTVALLVAFALVGAMGIAPADAKKKKKKKKKPAPVSVELDYFLGSTGCSTADTNFDYLTITDADDAVECWYTASGIRNDINSAAGVSDREAQSRYWDTIDGGSVVLDTSKPITGEIYTSGPTCVVTGQPCSPAPVSVGEVILELTMNGYIGEEKIELATQVDRFQVLPGQTHKTDVEFPIVEAHKGVVFDKLELVTWIHGNSVGHGVVKTQSPSSSFIKVTTLK